LRIHDRQAPAVKKTKTDQLLDCVIDMLRHCPTIVLIFDALEECPEDSRRDELFPFLRKLAGLKMNGLRLLLTSTPEPDIQVFMSQFSISTTLFKLDLRSANKCTGCLDKYISKELSRSGFYGLWNDDCKAQVRDALNAKADGMWVIALSKLANN
jgi:archaellum biogenesis ATPase FlaH